MIFKKSAIAFLALFVLSGCNTTKKPERILPRPSEASLISDFEKNVGDTIHFAFNKSDLSCNAKSQLDKQAAWLKDHANMKATIEGHCDDRGTREYNLALGERRATAVLRYLNHKGIEACRLDTISYGKEKPAVTGHTEDAWAQNRRAVTNVR